ncbi:MAG TPA: BON domain-containing protein [Candidatus Acidoferrales bacterium]|nr:BON domain-containing protein [Candidatus Acidoferrales bacterium]
MKLPSLIASLFLLMAITACSKSDNSQSTSSTSTSSEMASNTAPTASDQPTNEADTKIAQDVRQALTSDSSLSTAAQNVTVVASNGTVTLRGNVKDSTEKQKVADKATQVAGVSNVDNQLTVTQ